MAYEPTIWKDRVVEKPRTFNIINNPDGTVTLVPAPGVVVEEGTPVNAANLNKLEQGLKTHEADNANPHNTVATGSYIGNETSRFINVGFTPKFLLLYDKDSAIERGFFFKEQSSPAFRVYNSSSAGLKIQTSNTPIITDLGFNVNISPAANRDGTTYIWVAWM